MADRGRQTLSHNLATIHLMDVFVVSVSVDGASAVSSRKHEVSIDYQNFPGGGS